MTIPDKIYCGNNGHGNLSFSTQKVYDSMDEYIRKDALLEWLREQEEHGEPATTIQHIINRVKTL